MLGSQAPFPAAYASPRYSCLSTSRQILSSLIPRPLLVLSYDSPTVYHTEAQAWFRQKVMTEECSSREVWLWCLEALHSSLFEQSQNIQGYSATLLLTNPKDLCLLFNSYGVELIIEEWKLWQLNHVHHLFDDVWRVGQCKRWFLNYITWLYCIICDQVTH